MGIERKIITNRMYYLRAVRESVICRLFDKDYKKSYKTLLMLAQENTLLLNVYTNTFFFNGRWWPWARPVNIKQCNKAIHPSMYAKIQEATEKYEKISLLRNSVETLIGNLLTHVYHSEDVLNLFPETLLHHLPSNIAELYTSESCKGATPIPKEQVQEILAKNAPNFKYLKILLATRLLIPEDT